MKKSVKSVLSLALCLCLCLGMVMPANAVNSENITFSATLDNPTLSVSSEAQTVKMTVSASAAMTLESIGGQVTWPSGLTLTAIDNSDSRIDFAGSVNLDNGKIGWDGTAALDQLDNVTNIAVVTFTVPANTPAGTYVVGLTDLELTRNLGTIWESGASVTATLTIVAAPANDAYTAGLTASNATPKVGQQVTVSVNARHNAQTPDTVFAAGEVAIAYDSAKLSFNQTGSNLNGATVDTATAGELKLADYGENQNLGDGIYTLVFDVLADGAAEVKLTSAAFVNKEDAVKSDLIDATLSPAAVTLTISKEEFQVTLPDGFTGPAVAVDGQSYTFRIEDTNYNYSNIAATVGGSAVTVRDNGDGSYTVENVTGELKVTATATPKTHQVSITGTYETSDGNQATYLTDYHFTLKPDVAASAADGVTYSVGSVTIGGTAYTGYTSTDRVYTIPGSAITGDIVITVTETPVPADKWTVTVAGSGSGAAQGYTTTVDKDGSYTLTLTPEAGYSYTVTATMGEDSADVVDNQDNTYTVSNITGNLVFTVDKTVVVSGVTVSAYLTLDGNNMWLIKNTTAPAEGKVPTYNGEKMFWSEKYNAYCYLVIAQTLSEETAKAAIDIVEGTATNVNYGMDVNLTGTVDASDAQLVYNIYNADYSAFNAEVTVEKLLRADVNGDAIVNVNDATAIIAAILNSTATG